MRHQKTFLIVPFMLLIFIFRDGLFAHALIYEGDTLLNFFPYIFYFANGGAHLNFDLLSGFPIAASVTGVWYYPVAHLLLTIFDPIRFYTVSILLHFSLTIIMTYLYARSLRLSTLTATIVATVFAFSGQLMLWGTTVPNTNYYFLLPAALYGLERMRQSTRPLIPLIIVGCLLGLGWLSGHPQFIIYIHATVIGYLFYFSYRERGVASWRALLFRLCALALISFSVGYAQIERVLRFVGESSRVQGTTVAQYVANGYLPQDIMHYILPFWENPLIRTTVPNLYLGIIPALLLFFGILQWKTIRDDHFRFFLIMFLFAMLSAVYYSPLGIALHTLPFFNAFRESTRIMLIGNFAAAVIIGFVIEQILLPKVFQIRWEVYLALVKKIMLFILLPVSLVGTAIHLFFTQQIEQWAIMFFDQYLYASTAQLPLDHYHQVLRQYVQEASAGFSLATPQVAVAAVMLILSYQFMKRVYTLRPDIVRVIMLIVIGIDLALVYGDRFDAVAASDLLERPHTVTAIAARHGDSGPYRVFSVFTGIAEYQQLGVECPTPTMEERLELQKEYLTPNLFMLYGMQSPDGYDNFMPAAVSDLLAYSGSDRAITGSLLAYASTSIEERVREFIARSDMLRMMNVRYVISPFPIEDPGFEQIFSEKIESCGSPVHVYELSDVWPRAFVTRRYQSLADAGAEASVFIERFMEFSDQHGVVVYGDFPDADEQAPLIMEGSAVRVQEGSDQLRFEVTAPEQGLLFTSYAWLPRWHAYRDGVPISILHANHAYMAIPVAQGAQTIELRYE